MSDRGYLSPFLDKFPKPAQPWIVAAIALPVIFVAIPFWFVWTNAKAVYNTPVRTLAGNAFGILAVTVLFLGGALLIGATTKYLDAHIDQTYVVCVQVTNGMVCGPEVSN